MRNGVFSRQKSRQLSERIDGQTDEQKCRLTDWLTIQTSTINGNSLVNAAILLTFLHREITRSPLTSLASHSCSQLMYNIWHVQLRKKTIIVKPLGNQWWSHNPHYVANVITKLKLANAWLTLFRFWFFFLTATAEKSLNATLLSLNVSTCRPPPES